VSKLILRGIIRCMDTATLREQATDALRWWEPMRLLYNAVLAAVIVTYFFVMLPSSKQILTLDGVLFLFVLAVLANVAYCAAYVVDIFVQTSGYRESWRSYRWLLFLAGVTFAGVLTRYFALVLFVGSK